MFGRSVSPVMPLISGGDHGDGAWSRADLGDITGASRQPVGVEIRLLGPPELLVLGRSISLPTLPTRRLLVLLAVGVPRPVSVERLVDLMWPSTDGSYIDTAGALRALRTAIWRLRGRIDSFATLETLPGAYRLLMPLGCVDADAFETDLDRAVDHRRARNAHREAECLDVALSRWRGRAFEGLDDETWAVPLAARLEHMRSAAMIRRVELLLTLGSLDQAYLDALQLIEVDPLGERPRALAMIALYRLGRQSLALQCYRMYRRLLVDEIGVDPSPELIRLESAVLVHDVAFIDWMVLRAER